MRFHVAGRHFNACVFLSVHPNPLFRLACQYASQFVDSCVVVSVRLSVSCGSMLALKVNNKINKTDENKTELKLKQPTQNPKLQLN